MLMEIASQLAFTSYAADEALSGACLGLPVGARRGQTGSLWSQTRSVDQADLKWRVSAVDPTRAHDPKQTSSRTRRA
jgi:hypothetical protein